MVFSQIKYCNYKKIIMLIRVRMLAFNNAILIIKISLYFKLFIIYLPFLINIMLNKTTRCYADKQQNNKHLINIKFNEKSYKK